MRAELPDAVGGVLWFGTDDANMMAFTPVYCCTDRLPKCYSGKTADCVTFSWDSAFWIYNWVADMIRPRYSIMIDDMRAVQNKLEDTYENAQAGIESAAKALYDKDPKQAVDFLTNYTEMTAHCAVDEWKKLGEYIIVKYNDMVVKKETNGTFDLTPDGIAVPPQRDGFPENYRKEIINHTGDKYLIPNAK